MRRLGICFIVLAVMSAPGLATQMSDLASRMQPGTWAELVTSNINTALSTSGASGFIFGYTEDIQWDPNSHKLLFVGGDHGDTMRFVTYSESTNSWQIPPQPSWIPGGTNHGYDHHAIDPVAGVFYTRQGYYGKIFQRYKIASGTWSALPSNDLLEYDQCCAGVEYFPEMAGLVWVQGGETGSGGGVFLYQESTTSWTRLGRDLPMGDYHNFAEYNPVHKVMIFGGGNNAGQAFNKMNSAGQITRLRNSPIELGTQQAVVTVDPVSGEFLVFAANNTFYTYDVLSDTWSNRSGNTPVFGGAVHGVVASPISTYGVTLFVTALTSPFKVYLYKHSAGGGTPAPALDTTAPTAPANLSAAAASPTQVNLSWSASSDNVGVTGYRVIRNNTQAGTATGTSYQDTALLASTAYSYKVQAFDAAGNSSAFSSSVNITTPQEVVSLGGGVVPAEASPATNDFETRRQAPGVVRWFSFDSQAETDPHIFPPWGTTTKLGKVVTDIMASGAGSLRFEIPSNSGSDTSGSFFLNFSDDLSVQFGEGQEFFVQWRQRFSPEFLNTYYQGGGGWKQAIIGEGDRPGETIYSCTQLEIVTQNTYQRGFPQMYHSCGGKDGHYESFETPVNGDFLLQNNVPGCLYSLVSNSSSKSEYIPPCIGYKANQWMTFQVRIKIGTWYKNDGNYHRDSVVELRVANEGEPSQMVINKTGYDIANNDPAAKYGKVWLLPYHTKKDASQAHPTAYTWYDELIISRQRIPDPTPGSTGGPGPDTVAPASPGNLTVR